MANFRAKGKPATPSPLVRPRPERNGSFVSFAAEDDGFCAYVHRDVLERIEAHAREGGRNEVIGLLAGRICQDLQRVPYTLVMAAEGAVGGEATSGPSSVHISPEGRASVSHRLMASHPDREIVGWYHSHPHGSPHFSMPDTKEQAGWTDANHVGIVVAVRGREGQPAARGAADAFGVYRGPGALRLARRAPSQAARGKRNIVIKDSASKAAHQYNAREQERAAPVTTELAVVRQALPAAGAQEPTQEPPPANAVVQTPVTTKRRASESYVPHVVVLLVALAALTTLVWMHMRISAVELAQRTSGDAGVVNTAAPAAPSSTVLPAASASVVAPQPTMAEEQSFGHAETGSGIAGLPQVADVPFVSVPSNPNRPDRYNATQRMTRDRAKAAEEAEAKKARAKAAKAKVKASSKAAENANAAPKVTNKAKESNGGNSNGSTEHRQQTPNATPTTGTRQRLGSPSPTP
jgi:proteasome lid subunit RPN8/RPN11